jgi:hypothetical protein
MAITWVTVLPMPWELPGAATAGQHFLAALLPVEPISDRNPFEIITPRTSLLLPPESAETTLSRESVRVW